MNKIKQIFANIKRAICDWFYGIRVKIHNKLHKNSADKPSKKNISSKRKSELLFYLSFVSLPIIQFCVFYIAVNANSIRLAFSSYDTAAGAYKFAGFGTFKLVFGDIFAKGSQLGSAFLNSLLFFAITTSISIFLALVFSYYIFKKNLGSGFFRVMLFLPSVISVMILVMIFQYAMNWALPEIIVKLGGERPEALMTSESTRRAMVLFFNILIGFGPSTLIYTSSMSSIDSSIVEAAQIDGVKPFQEFTKIIFPLIFPTFTTFMVTAVAGIFNNQYALFSFYGHSSLGPDLETVGFLIFRDISEGTVTLDQYCYISALGLVCSFVAIPVTFCVKYFMEKCDPTAVK